MTLNTVLQAAWAILLGRLSGHDDVVFGVTVAGRPPEIAGVESMVGLFINTLPLRVKLPPGKPFARVAQRGAGQPVAADRAPASRPCRDPERWPDWASCSTRLWCSRTIRSTRAPCQRQRAGCGCPGQRARRDALSAAPVVMPGGATARCGSTIKADLFDRATAQRLAERLIRLLEAAVAAPDAALSRLEILSAAERGRILEEWNATARALPGATLRSCLRRRLRDACGGRGGVRGSQLSYAELDARSNQLAHHLRALGVGPETVVGLLLERSPELVVGLMAILKAGGAYLPLDPCYPAERLSFMLADAGARACW